MFLKNENNKGELSLCNELKTIIMGLLISYVTYGIGFFFLWDKWARAGTQKAKVFPDPVSAMPMMSRPFMRTIILILRMKRNNTFK